MKGDELEFPGFDPLHDVAADLGRKLRVAAVSPPDQDIGLVERFVSYALIGVIEAGRANLEARLFLQISSDFVAKEIVIGLGLFGLLLIPDKDSYRARLPREYRRSRFLALPREPLAARQAD